MKRRDFIVGLGGLTSSGVLPGALRAQQRSSPVIGFLRSASNIGAEHIIGAYRQGLADEGFTEERNVRVLYASAEGNVSRLPALTMELVRQQVSLIACNQISAIAAKAATSTIPIVFAGGSDPVQDGLVESLNRPGRNITGVVFFAGLLGAKRMELLSQLVPKAMSIGLLVNPLAIDTEAERRDVIAAAQTIGKHLVVRDVQADQDFEAAFASFAARGVDAVFVGTGAFMNTRRTMIVALAARHRLPAVYPWREAAMAGGLMSYGASISDAYRQLGLYSGRILKGEKPTELPVMRSSRFEMAINLKTARALGISVPATLLAIAEEVIE
jgi:putative ABC transport system substrate-binding protein